MLYHSVEYSQGDSKLLLDESSENFDEIAAFFLTLSQERVAYFLEYDAFKKLSKEVIINGFLDGSTLFEFCFKVLQRVEKDANLVDKYLQVFSYLASVDLISATQLKSLQSIFESYQVGGVVQKKGDEDFLQHKERLHLLIGKLRGELDSKALQNELDLLSEYLHKKTFSIGITGVMNVGKSTFINALLAQELLGASVVAETANLSVLKYAKEPYAKVVFLNSLEFEALIRSVEHPLSGELDINRYIKEHSLVIDVMQDELQRYTSATDNISNIVKNVELGVDVEFLKDSIEIVDTPGLDDTLILRESITKNYIESCDLLIHLMNVNQSATQKDVEFLLSALNNNNLSAILILLTKVDNITKDELEQVMQYTKKTILSQLDTKLPIEFLSISASTKVGIDGVREYLHHTLFQSNTKNIALLNNTTAKLIHIIQKQREALQYKMALYSKDERSLALELKELQQTKHRDAQSIQKITLQLDAQMQAYGDFVEGLEPTFQKELALLKEKVVVRVVDELSYGLKNKLKPKPRQITMLIDKTLSHGYIDTIREYKYKLKQQIMMLSKKMELSFQEYKLKVDLQSSEESLAELFERNANSSLNTSIKMLSKRANTLLESMKKPKVERFKEEFMGIVEEEFLYVLKNIDQTKERLNKEIADEFLHSLKKPIERLRLEMKERESLLSSHIYALQHADEKPESLKVKIQNKINALNLMLGTLV